MFAHTYKKRIIISLLLFMSIFFLLGLPYVQWYFFSDDFGLILYTKIKTWTDLFGYFEGIDASKIFVASHQELNNSFFNALYRPFLFIFAAIQQKFFGEVAYYYYLVAIAIHALNSVILFNIFLYFFDYVLALLGALFFAFHPSLLNWMGWICAQNYEFDLLFFLLASLLFKRYLDTKRIGYHLIAGIIYALALFNRETQIVFPLWIATATYFYETYKGRLTGLSLRNVARSFKMSLGFWGIAFSYLAMRLALFPMQSVQLSQRLSLNPFTILYNFKYRFFDVVTFIADFLGLSWIPQGHRFIKGSLIILVSAVLLCFFIKNSKKKWILWWVFSFTLFMWPAILRYCGSKFLYISLPFLVLIFLFNFVYAKVGFGLNSIVRRRIGLICFSGVIGLYLIAFMINLKTREQNQHKAYIAYRELAQHPAIKNRVLCFLGVPVQLFHTGITQAMRLHTKEMNQLVYYDWWLMIDSVADLTENDLDVIPKDGGLRIVSKSPQKLWMFLAGDREAPFSLGTRVEYGRKKGKVYDVHISFDQKWLNQRMLFITWDFKRERFKVREDLSELILAGFLKRKKKR